MINFEDFIEHFKKYVSSMQACGNWSKLSYTQFFLARKRQVYCFTASLTCMWNISFKDISKEG